jgi:hypothetical protein
VAAAESRQTVYMDANSTPTDCFVRFMNSFFFGLSDTAHAADELKVEITSVDAEAEARKPTLPPHARWSGILRSVWEIERQRVRAP